MDNPLQKNFQILVGIRKKQVANIPAAITAHSNGGDQKVLRCGKNGRLPQNAAQDASNSAVGLHGVYTSIYTGICSRTGAGSALCAPHRAHVAAISVKSAMQRM